jgi:3-hydroxyisobutyrate dehydrogenase-like beta-hydroxyacid dehydrogenase
VLIVCLLTYDTVYEALQPATAQLKGKVLVNLTNGTPAQAREMAAWATSQGAIYLDGGIMAVPPMIGMREALILYSGNQQAFNKYKDTLDILASSQFVGDDAGLAPLHDISLLIGMYGMFSGALQAMALITSEKVPAQQFMGLLKPWLLAMLDQVEIMAGEIDKGDYTSYVASTLGMQAAAYVNMIEASKAQKLSTELITPLNDLFQRAVKEGYSPANISALIEVIRKPL